MKETIQKLTETIAKLKVAQPKCQDFTLSIMVSQYRSGRVASSVYGYLDNQQFIGGTLDELVEKMTAHNDMQSKREKAAKLRAEAEQIERELTDEQPANPPADTTGGTGEGMNNWTKLPAIEGSIACATCGAGAHETLEMGTVIAVGFGDAGVTKDGEDVYRENPHAESEDEFWTVAKAEEEAAKDPDHDWRIYFFAPLWEGEYQRQGDKHWVLIKRGMGFA